MWGWKAGRRLGHLKEFNKTLWTKKPRATLSEPRLNLADAKVTLKKEGYSIIYGCSIIQH